MSGTKHRVGGWIGVLLVLAGSCGALAQTPSAQQVVVEFSPMQGGNRDRDLSGAPAIAGQMKRLARFVSEAAAPRLASGETLNVRFDEVVLAGSLEPWRAPTLDGVRFVTAAYPPRLALSFRWIAADGSLIREGERRLTNLEFQRDPRAALSNDPLRYERALLEAWIERELAQR